MTHIFLTWQISLLTPSPKGFFLFHTPVKYLFCRAFWPLWPHPGMLTLLTWPPGAETFDLWIPIFHFTFEFWYLPVFQPLSEGHWAPGVQCFCSINTPAASFSNRKNRYIGLSATSDYFQLTGSSPDLKFKDLVKGVSKPSRAFSLICRSSHMQMSRSAKAGEVLTLLPFGVCH